MVHLKSVQSDYLRKHYALGKKSYGTRSERGKRFAERISSVAGTIKRKDLNAINFFKEAVCAFYRGEEAPYLSVASGF